MNFGGMEKMVQGFIKSALRDPKKRAYIEKVMMDGADTAALQKYVNIKLYGKYIENGEIKEFDEDGDIPKILERLAQVEENQKQILSLLQKIAGEK